MANEKSDSFIRWQSVTREHFTSTSSLVLMLSTGLLAFVSERLLAKSHPTYCTLLIGSAAVLLLVLSITLALWCSITRLRDFRATAQIARRRDRNEHIPPEDRLETKILGERSWLLFWWQLTLFGVGAAVSAIALLIRG